MHQDKRTGKIKKTAKAVFILALIFIIGGTGGVFADRYILPKLSHYDFWAGFNWIKKINEKVTIINKTEQIVVEEYDSISETASQAASAVVNIASAPNDSASVATKEDSFNYNTETKNGTGVIITGDGLIVTYRNAIIEERAAYKVWIFDGSSYEAELLGIDDFTNLAYLKIDASNLPVIPFANAEDFKPGKKLIAIGNFSGEYQNNFSAGLLSGINKIFNLSGKTVSSSEKLEGVFETDLNNQPGCAGCPIINYSGELVGITGSIEINNGDRYFQIPFKAVKESADLAIAGNFKKRASLGIYYLPLTKSYAWATGLKRDRGALIYSPSGKQGLAILAGSSAEKAKLKINDIIIAVNGEEINLDNPLSNLISRYKKGDQAEFLIIREKEMKIKLEF